MGIILGGNGAQYGNHLAGLAFVENRKNAKMVVMAGDWRSIVAPGSRCGMVRAAAYSGLSIAGGTAWVCNGGCLQPRSSRLESGTIR